MKNLKSVVFKIVQITEVVVSEHAVKQPGCKAKTWKTVEKGMKEEEKTSLFIFTASHTACVSRSFSNSTPACPQPSSFYPSSSSQLPPASSSSSPIYLAAYQSVHDKKEKILSIKFSLFFGISVSNNGPQGNLKEKICFWFGLMGKFYKSNTMSCYNT